MWGRAGEALARQGASVSLWIRKVWASAPRSVSGDAHAYSEGLHDPVLEALGRAACGWGQFVDRLFDADVPRRCMRAMDRWRSRWMMRGGELQAVASAHAARGVASRYLKEPCQDSKVTSPQLRGPS